MSRLSPAELARVVSRFGAVRAGSAVDRLHPATATKIEVAAPATVEMTVGAQVRVAAAGLPPALLATLRHAAAIPNPLFYDRERRRLSTWDTPRFLRLYDETVDGDLLLPRGMLDRLTALLAQAGS